MLDYVNANIFHVSCKSREAIKSEKNMDNMSIWQLLVSEQDSFTTTNTGNDYSSQYCVSSI